MLVFTSAVLLGFLAVFALCLCMRIAAFMVGVLLFAMISAKLTLKAFSRASA